jgi:HEAT repeat protein
MNLDHARATGDIDGLIGFFSGSSAEGIRFAEGQIAVEALVTIGAPAVPRLINALINSPDEDTKWRSAQALRSIGIKSVPVAPLIDGLHSPIGDVRKDCVWVLAVLGPAIVEPQLRSLTADSLIQCLSDERHDVRKMAADAIAGVVSEKDGIRLQAIMEGADQDVREGIAAAINRIGITEELAPLFNGLIDVNLNVRMQSAEQLGQAASKTQYVPQRNAIINALIHALKEDRQMGVRGAAAQALGMIGDPMAIPALEEAVKHETFWPARDSALAALDTIRNRAK